MMFCDEERGKVYNISTYTGRGLYNNTCYKEDLFIATCLVRTDVLTDEGCIGYKTKTSYGVRLCEGTGVIL